MPRCRGLLDPRTPFPLAAEPIGPAKLPLLQDWFDWALTLTIESLEHYIKNLFEEFIEYCGSLEYLENQLQENNDAANGDSAQNNQQSAEQAPKPDDSQGSEDSTGQPSEQNSDQKNTGSASGKEATDSENLEKTGQKESQKNPVTPQEGKESEKEEQSDQAAAYLNGNEKGEQEQMLQQWLRKVPDDPGQLIRNKMRLESLRRRQASELNHETDFW